MKVYIVIDETKKGKEAIIRVFTNQLKAINFIENKPLTAYGFPIAQ